MTQLTLSLHPETETQRSCGTCVVRNAINEQEEHGDCAYSGRRHRDDRACGNWFGLDELRKPLYGRAKR